MIDRDRMKDTFTFYLGHHVATIVTRQTTGVYFAGISYTSPRDNFNRKLGRMIAANRCFHNASIKHQVISGTEKDFRSALAFELNLNVAGMIDPKEIEETVDLIIKTMNKKK